ncbi:hypothetical protein J4E89_010246 [Alternaria sp. Ai002NY15]|nr:hypothetical protein J4E89_010246 [Alternaria sp. Ai002NY15]
MASNPDEHTLGNSGADITLVDLMFGDLSYEDMEPSDEELFKRAREELRRNMPRDLSLPSSDRLASFATNLELAIAASEWIEHNFQTEIIQEAPTKDYSPMVVNTVAEAVFDPQYDMPNDLPDGTTATDFHLQVYFCAVAMGMNALQHFAFKFMCAALGEDGLTPEQLRSLVENHGLFTPAFCKKTRSALPFHKVMCTLATHIVLYEDDLCGSKVYSDLFLTTEGYLPYWLNKVRRGVKAYVEVIKREDPAAYRRRFPG